MGEQVTIKQVEQVYRLRHSGYSTPDICSAVDLSSTVVLDILLQELSALDSSQVDPNGLIRTREQWSERERSKLAHFLTAPATEFGFCPSALWTLPRLIEFTHRVMGKRLSKDTLRRRLKKQGLTFSGQLNILGLSEVPASVFELQLQHPRHHVYVLTWVKARDVGLERLGYPATLVGISSTNRIAFSVWSKSRLSRQGRRQFPIRFIQELLQLHRESHLIVLVQEGLISSSMIRKLVSHHCRLHIVSIEHMQ